MTLSCLHTHTIFCDGKTDVETMCEAAYAKGFALIGFSSHAPITKKTGMTTVWHMKDEKLDEYIGTVTAARKRWKGKLTVFLGLEVDYIKGFCGPADRDIQELPLDYIIGSTHYVVSPKDGAPFNIDTWPEDFCEVMDFFNNDGKAFCEAYFDAFNSMVSAGGSDILGHLDLLKKNNSRHNFFSPEEIWYGENLVNTADKIAAARSDAEKNGRRVPVVELNTNCMIRGYHPEPYPSPAMMSLLAERNIPLVMNADAHNPDHLGGYYETGRKLAMQAGYSSMVIFEGRENGKALWRTRNFGD